MKMKIAKLVLLGAFVFGASISAEAATSAPQLHAPGATTLASHWVKDEKKKKHAHAHRVHKKKVAELHAVHKTHKVKKVKLQP
jgi:hypothetical protein